MNKTFLIFECDIIICWRFLESVSFPVLGYSTFRDQIKTILTTFFVIFSDESFAKRFMKSKHFRKIELV